MTIRGQSLKNHHNRSKIHDKYEPVTEQEVENQRAREEGNRPVEFDEEEEKRKKKKRANERWEETSLRGESPEEGGKGGKPRNRSAARITGSILSCDSSRFDYEALAFAPLRPTPLPLPLIACTCRFHLPTT